MSGDPLWRIAWSVDATMLLAPGEGDEKPNGKNAIALRRHIECIDADRLRD
jgi:hypothetical protein